MFREIHNWPTDIWEPQQMFSAAKSARRVLTATTTSCHRKRPLTRRINSRNSNKFAQLQEFPTVSFFPSDSGNSLRNTRFATKLLGCAISSPFILQFSITSWGCFLFKSNEFRTKREPKHFFLNSLLLENSRRSAVSWNGRMIY